jgi:hypothetical protein
LLFDFPLENHPVAFDLFGIHDSILFLCDLVFTTV